jgi:hypothetical protein
VSQRVIFHPQYGYIPADPSFAYGNTDQRIPVGPGGQPIVPGPVPPELQPQPWPPPPGARPNMNVQTLQSLAARPGTTWHPVSVADPMPLVPEAPDGTIAMAFRTRTARFPGLAAGTPGQVSFQFDNACALYSRTAAIRTTNGQALPAIAANPLDLFDVQFQRQATGDTLDIDGGMGGALLGTAQRPAYLGGRGWQFDNGNPLTIIVTPAAANLLIDVSVMFVEFLGPQNYNVG